MANKRFKHFSKKFDDKWFEVVGETDGTCTFDDNDDTEIYKVYGKPSDAKQWIWFDWCHWAKRNNAQLKIAGHSCMFFSISGYIIDTDGTRYELFITASHNRAYIVK